MKQIALAVLAVGLAQSQLRAQNTASEHASAVVVPAGTAKYGAAPGSPSSGVTSLDCASRYPRLEAAIDAVCARASNRAARGAR